MGVLKKLIRGYNRIIHGQGSRNVGSLEGLDKITV